MAKDKQNEKQQSDGQEIEIPTKEHVDFLHARINDLEAFVHEIAKALTTTDQAVVDGIKAGIKDFHDAYATAKEQPAVDPDAEAKE